MGFEEALFKSYWSALYAVCFKYLILFLCAIPIGPVSFTVGPSFDHLFKADDAMIKYFRAIETRQTLASKVVMWSPGKLHSCVSKFSRSF